jgi:hypothetical protein
MLQVRLCLIRLFFRSTTPNCIALPLFKYAAWWALWVYAECETEWPTVVWKCSGPCLLWIPRELSVLASCSCIGCCGAALGSRNSAPIRSACSANHRSLGNLSLITSRSRTALCSACKNSEVLRSSRSCLVQVCVSLASKQSDYQFCPDSGSVSHVTAKNHLEAGVWSIAHIMPKAIPNKTYGKVRWKGRLSE